MDKHQTTIGAFVLGSMALLLACLIFFGKFQPFRTTQHAFSVFPGSAAGLTVGAAVTFRGVTVGSVRSVSIAYDPATNTAFIPVEMDLTPERLKLTPDASGGSTPTMAGMVARGLRAELNVQSFVTGQSNVNLDFAPKSAAILHPNLGSGIEIPSRASDIERMKQTLTQLPLKQTVDEAQAAIVSVRALADELRSTVPPLTNSLKETSDSTRAAIEDLRGHLDETLASVARLADHGTTQLDARGADLHTLLARTDASLQRADAILAHVATMTSPRSSERADLASALRDIAASAAALRGFASDVERNPQLLLTGRRP
ncbi:paraquat-inducible protein B [Ameyamaea chiangmaiensis NBRC 103196]|uniref:MCE family protein n=1 Tax=Ameyamaea chiangmaiensis TaxID=442969 RepID=A0A850PGA7_9PROT|nr:MlaD family protein [Ameyamaea chiangmaiensis]MBS4073953.1 MCE family protein [Ameyamaea chiangmaiensis]NVN41669.1 MCE family protein [Ameyamaea chiangmaiensis]GBQ67805.1 paraquat-inducible protein B [Ameyamaea chiangmaiensis NBRC 103196]